MSGRCVVCNSVLTAYEGRWIPATNEHGERIPGRHEDHCAKCLSANDSGNYESAPTWATEDLEE